MPIHPDQRHRYPKDWIAISARVRREAGHRCERCHVRDRAWGFRDRTGAFHELDQDRLREEFGAHARPPLRLVPAGDAGALVRVIEIVLTVAHLDHQPENNRPINLAALCQRCHLGHDRPQHVAVRATRRHQAMGTAELPLDIRASEAA